jgi:hypothetical protein
MSIVLRAFPIRAKEQLHSFVDSLNGNRQREADTFYRSYDVSHESWHLQDTPSGPWVICLTIVDNPTEAAPRYASSTAEFESWFKSQVMQVTGINLNVEPLGPPTELIYAWSDRDRPNSALF